MQVSVDIGIEQVCFASEISPAHGKEEQQPAEI